MNSRIQQHARARALGSADHVRTGPFVLRHDRGWDNPAANYAIPDDGAAPTAEDVAALVGAFRERERLPRLEYLPSCAPLVEPALLAAGFTVENRATVMACAAGALRAPDAPSGVVLREPADEAEFLAAALVQHLGYGGSADDADADAAKGGAARLHATADGGGFVALAADERGTVAGIGICTAPLDGLSELAGLAVAPAFRRRGVAAALAAHLTATALAGGCETVWLEPGDPDIQRIYARIGYRVVDEKLNISLTLADPG
jgi:ribosomal protein S18 acetylase RimI-like enzyme